MIHCGQEILIWLLVLFLVLRHNISGLHEASNPDLSFQFAWKLKETNSIWPKLDGSMPFIYEIEDDILIFELGQESSPSVIIKSTLINITIDEIQNLEIFEVGLKNLEMVWDYDTSLCRLETKSNKWEILPVPKKYIKDFGYTHGYDIEKDGIYSLAK